MLNAAQLSTLKSAVGSTPPLLALWQAGTPVPIAEQLSDPADAAYGGPVTLARVPRDDLLAALRPALGTLPGLSAAVQSKWDRVLSWVRSSDGVPVDAGTISLFNSAVADGVLTQAQATACYQRQGSWAEVHFGAGTSLDWRDVAVAMNS